MVNVDQLLRDFLEEKRRIGGSDRTSRTYASTLNTFRSHIAQEGLDLLPSQVLPHDEASIYSEKLGEQIESYTHTANLSSRTKSLRKSVLKSFYSTMENKVFFPHPIAEKTTGRARKKSKMTPDQVDQLIQSIPNTETGKRDKALIMFYLETGANTAVIKDIFPQDLVWNGTEFKFETVLLSKKASSLLLDWLESHYGLNWQQIKKPLFVSFSPSRKGKDLAMTTQGLTGIIRRVTGYRMPYIEK